MAATFSMETIPPPLSMAATSLWEAAKPASSRWGRGCRGRVRTSRHMGEGRNDAGQHRELHTDLAQRQHQKHGGGGAGRRGKRTNSWAKMGVRSG